MKAMILKKPAPIEKSPLALVNISEPNIGPKDILIKNSVCGVCHTDLHIVEGEIEMHKSPVIPGHQIVGQVYAIGNAVKKFSVGDRVGIAWLNSSCGICEFCKSGRENLCDSAQFTGYDRDGGYAEFTAISEDFAYPISNTFDDFHTAPLLCAGIIGYRALKLCFGECGATFMSQTLRDKSRTTTNERLGLYGFGASAHIVTQVAKYLGCDVYVFTRSENHKILAKELGAVWTGYAEDSPPELMDSSIIFAPSGKIIPEALRALKKGGTLALASIYMTPIPEMNYNLIYGERTIKSVTNSTRQDAIELLSLSTKIPIKTDIEVFPLKEANSILKLLKNSKIRGSAVLEIS